MITRFFQLRAIMILIVLLLASITPSDHFIGTATTQGDSIGSIFSANEVIFVIDKSQASGSASVPFLDLKDAIKRYVRILANTSSVPSSDSLKAAVIAYDWEFVGVEVFYALSDIRTDQSRLSTFDRAIDQIPSPRGDRWTAGAIDQACFLTQKEPGLGALILFTSGLPNQPGGLSNAKQATEDAAENFRNNCSLLSIVYIGNNQSEIDFFRSIATSDELFATVSPGATVEDILSAIQMASGKDLGTGDIQLTLTWDSSADLDLHVFDPFGAEISFRNPTVESGGRLDIDKTCSNGGQGPENVFWPEGEAPNGQYRVEINYFSDCNQDIGTTSWTLRALINGGVQTRNGTIEPGQTRQILTFSITN